MKQKWIKVIGLFLALFTILFLGRWFYLYQVSKKTSVEVPAPVYQPSTTEPQATYQAPEKSDDDSDAKDTPAEEYEFRPIAFHNYAKETVSGGPVAQAGGKQAAEQVLIYEKVAAMAARTRDYDADEKKVRDIIRDNQGLVQQEEKDGLKGARIVTLTLGVVPDRFDAVVNGLKGIGELVSFRTTKTDKTQDCESLKAQRASLEKNRNDLVALKSAGGKIKDLLGLQGKIFNLEKEIEDLGIEIGQYESATGFCTALLTLKEIGPGTSPWLLAFAAFDWTLDTCLPLLLWVFFISLALLFINWVVGKAKSGTGGSNNLKDFFAPGKLE